MTVSMHHWFILTAPVLLELVTTRFSCSRDHWTWLIANHNTIPYVCVPKRPTMSHVSDLLIFLCQQYSKHFQQASVSRRWHVYWRQQCSWSHGKLPPYI